MMVGLWYSYSKGSHEWVKVGNGGRKEREIRR
jgi:hypothetical protein